MHQLRRVALGFQRIKTQDAAILDRCISLVISDNLWLDGQFVSPKLKPFLGITPMALGLEGYFGECPSVFGCCGNNVPVRRIGSRPGYQVFISRNEVRANVPVAMMNE